MGQELGIRGMQIRDRSRVEMRKLSLRLLDILVVKSQQVTESNDETNQ